MHHLSDGKSHWTRREGAILTAEGTNDMLEKAAAKTKRIIQTKDGTIETVDVILFDREVTVHDVRRATGKERKR